MSEFLLKIVRTDGKPVHLRPGGKGEVDLIDAVRAEGIGFLKTEAQVLDAIRHVIRKLKAEVEPL